MGARRCLKKKKFIASFLRQHGCVYVRNGRFLEFRRATRGPDLAQVHTWRRGTPGAEESTGLRSRDLDSGSSPSAHQPLGNSVCPSGKWEARLFKIFPSFFFLIYFSVLGRSCSTETCSGTVVLASGLSSCRHGLMWGLSPPTQASNPHCKADLNHWAAREVLRIFHLRSRILVLICPLLWPPEDTWKVLAEALLRVPMALKIKS